MALSLRVASLAKSNFVVNPLPLIRCFHGSASNRSNESGWFNKFLMVQKIEPVKDSHSRLLSDSDAVYEMQTEDVIPGHMDEYLKTSEYLVNEIKGKADGYELVGSFKVIVGDRDQIVNIWRYHNGYPNASKVQRVLNEDTTLINIQKDQSKLLRKRDNQFMMSFSFWSPAESAERNCYYELRSYVLKPGTLIEWGNSWARGIHFRQNRVAGYFTQIGQLYMVHHLWHYEDLQNRQEVRQNAWMKPGWDEILRNTVPLIREMRSRWMIGNSFSPIR